MRRAFLLAAAFVALAAAPIASKGPYQYYPNIPGEVLLENDRLVVQKFVIEPGQWEGVHSHPGNQLYVHIRGGEWTVRKGTEKTTSVDADGSIGWMDKIELSEDHESGNTGEAPIELLWITLK
jgi:predicted metal-dependent enzyme (double-stranded beta helix superfamily)